MVHHQFGAAVGDEAMGAVFSMGDSILVREHSTVAVATIQEGKQLPIIALELAGRINKTQDTFQAVFVLSLLDAGGLARSLYEAAARVGTSEATTDFKVGLAGGTNRAERRRANHTKGLRRNGDPK